MKTDRRSFFKLGAGAAVAAPVAMSQVAKDMAKPYPMLQAANIGGLKRVSDEVEAISEGEWIRDQLASYTRNLANLNRSRPMHERGFEPAVAARIDGLRSVSPVNKARMMIEAREDLERTRERSWMQTEIDRLKERLGLLGGIF